MVEKKDSNPTLAEVMADFEDMNNGPNDHKSDKPKKDLMWYLHTSPDDPNAVIMKPAEA
jgi:hypothetical protein